MRLDTISPSDYIALAVGILGFLTAWLSRKDRLPAWARRWLKRIGPERIADAIERAGVIVELSPDERRKQAVVYLQRLTTKELGFPVPASSATLLVEQVYQQWKRARR